MLSASGWSRARQLDALSPRPRAVAVGEGHVRAAAGPGHCRGSSRGSPRARSGRRSRTARRPRRGRRGEGETRCVTVLRRPPRRRSRRPPAAGDADAGRRVDSTTPSPWRGTPRYDPVGDPVQVPLDPPDVVSPFSAGPSAERGMGGTQAIVDTCPVPGGGDVVTTSPLLGTAPRAVDHITLRLQVR